MKETAEVFRASLPMGLISVPDVVAWADHLIANLPDPPSALVDLSLDDHADPSDVCHHLALVPGAADPERVCRRLVGLMRDRLLGEPDSAQAIAKALYQLAIDGRIPEASLGSRVYYFWDALDLAANGVWGDFNAIRQELATFLAQAATR